MSQKVLFSSSKKTPVILLHGLFGFGSSGSFCNFALFKRFMKDVKPEQKVIGLNYCNLLDSLLTPLEDQVLIIKNEIEREIGDSPFILIGHSQGGLLGRCLLEEWDDHKCEKLISLGSPQCGVYGLAHFEFLPEIIKEFLKTLTTLDLEKATKLVYDNPYFRSTSLCDLWRDGKGYENYLEKNKFLPRYNNEIQMRIRYKENFLRVKEVHFLGSEKDKVIVPSESQFFRFQKKRIDDMNFFRDDLFGLRTMAFENRLFVKEIPNVEHIGWLFGKESFKDILNCL